MSEISKTQSYFNFADSWIKTEKAYGTFQLSNANLTVLLKQKLSERSTDLDEIDSLRKRYSISANDFRIKKTEFNANYLGGLYPTRDCVSKFFLFFDHINVEDSLAYTGALENLLQKGFIERYFDFHYLILADNIDFLRVGTLRFINQDWKRQQKIGAQTINDIIAEYTQCEQRELSRTGLKLPTEISKSETSRFLDQNIKVANFKTREYANKRSLIQGITTVGPIRKCNVMSCLCLVNNAWPTTEFETERFILKAKSDSFSSLNQLLPQKTEDAVRLTSHLLRMDLPFMKNLTARDYIRMKKDKKPYLSLRNYFLSVSDREGIDAEAEEERIQQKIKRIGRKMSRFKTVRKRSIKTGLVRTTAPLSICVLSSFLFPPLAVPVSVWSFKETYDLFHNLVESYGKLTDIKRNSFFSLWKLASDD